MIESFENLLRSTNREGIDNLIEYIRKSDFYTAPASTRFHSCHEGGLLEHSMNVLNCLKHKLDQAVWKEALESNSIDEAGIIIIALLHDLCKTNFYVVEMKNKKVYNDHGKKSDSNGRFDWEVVPGYTVDDKIPYGHGEKSVMMVEQFMKLKPIERYAIRWHMGFTEPKENWNTLCAAIKKYPIILAIHEADLESTYLLEEEE